MSLVQISDLDWAWLPKHLLDNILNKLVSLQDFIRFGAVCSQWRIVARDNFGRRASATNHQLPLLLIPSPYGDIPLRALYSMRKPGVLNTELHMPYNRRLCGSSHGWLIALDGRTFILLNPFTRQLKLLLPSFRGDNVDIDEDNNFNPPFNSGYIKKAILSGDPNTFPCALMVIYGPEKKLAMLKMTGVDKNKWTYIDREYKYFEDIIYYNDKFYAVNAWGRVFSYNVTESITVMDDVAPELSIVMHPLRRRYLVETSEGHLLQAIRLYHNHVHERRLRTFGFKIFRLECNIEGQHWKRLANLADGTLFLGDNHSIFVTASDYLGCQHNYVYYTDDGGANEIAGGLGALTGPYDHGVYSIEQVLTFPHFIPNNEQMRMPPPIWIVPTLNSYSINEDAW